MQANELRELSDAELAEKLAEGKKELFNLRFQNITGQLDNVRLLNQTRKQIARVLTVQRERAVKNGQAEQQTAQAEA